MHPVTAFWQWWAAGGEQELTAAVTAGEYGRLPDRISALVAAVHPELEWELGPGARAQHALCVTGAGVAELRPVAERWLRAAPAETPTWEFHAARRPDPDVLDRTLGLGGRSVPLGDVRVALDVTGDRVDVALWHPAAAGLREQERAQVAFLTLDWTLGEDDVERWVGAVAAPAEQPADTVPLTSLRAAVAELAARPDEGSWALLEGAGPDGTRVLVSVQRPLRWIDRPLLDLHSEVVVPVGDVRSDGLPGPAGLERLRALEDDLTAAVGGRAELLAHETRGGVRVLHLYSDGEDQNATDLVARWAAERGLRVDQRPDPAWRDLRAFS